jgi:hypothetical protein
MGILLLVSFSTMLIAVLPHWGDSRNWGYARSGSLGIFLVILMCYILHIFCPAPGGCTGYAEKLHHDTSFNNPENHLGRGAP